jgi:hypothetical protein
MSDGDGGIDDGDFKWVPPEYIDALSQWIKTGAPEKRSKCECSGRGSFRGMHDKKPPADFCHPSPEATPLSLPRTPIAGVVTHNVMGDSSAQISLAFRLTLAKTLSMQRDRPEMRRQIPAHLARQTFHTSHRQFTRQPGFRVQTSAALRPKRHSGRSGGKGNVRCQRRKTHAGDG